MPLRRLPHGDERCPRRPKARCDAAKPLVDRGSAGLRGFVIGHGLAPWFTSRTEIPDESLCHSSLHKTNKAMPFRTTVRTVSDVNETASRLRVCANDFDLLAYAVVLAHQRAGGPLANPRQPHNQRECM